MIELKPVLNKKEQEAIRLYNTLPYNQAVKEKDESALFKAIKTARKEQWLSQELKLENPNNLILTKGKAWSPLDVLMQKFIEVSPMKLLSPENLWKSTASVNKKVYAALEKPWLIFSKPTSEVLKAWSAIYYWAKGIYEEMSSYIKPDKIAPSMNKTSQWANLTPAITLQTKIAEDNIAKKMEKDIKSWLNVVQRWILNTADEFENNRSKVNILFWTTDWLSDYWSLHTNEERRRNAIAKAPEEKKEELTKFYGDTTAWQVWIDIVSQVAWWLASWTALSSIAQKTTNPVVAKALTTMGDTIVKYWMWANEILWATQAFSALAYYNSTWKYLFEDDMEATEAMIWWVFSSVVRWAGKAFLKNKEKWFTPDNIDWAKFLKEVNSDEWVSKGFSIMTNAFNNSFKELKEKTGNAIQDYVEKQWLVSRFVWDEGDITLIEKLSDDWMNAADNSTRNEKISNAFWASAINRFNKWEWTASEWKQASDKLNWLYEWRKFIMEEPTKINPVTWSSTKEVKWEIISGNKYWKVKIRMEWWEFRVITTSDLKSSIKEVPDEEIANFLRNAKYKWRKLVQREEWDVIPEVTMKAAWKEVDTPVSIPTPRARIKKERMKIEFKPVDKSIVREKLSKIKEQEAIEVTQKPLWKKSRDLIFNRVNEDLVDAMWLKWAEATKAVAKLQSNKVNWELFSIKSSIDRTISSMSDKELSDFNILLKLKNRLRQTENYKWELKTKWWTASEMKAAIDEIELSSINSKWATSMINTANAYIRDWLLKSWIINKEQWKAFNKNPFYIPSKLTADDIFKIGVNWRTTPLDGALIKSLKWWSDELEMDFKNWLTDAYYYYSKALRAINRNEYIGNIVNLSKQNWIDLIERHWVDYTEMTKAWFEKYSYKVNWEDVSIFLPKEVINELSNVNLWGDIQSAVAVIAKATAITKMFTTGWFAPAFWVWQLPTETLMGALKAYSVWWDMKAFLSLLPMKFKEKIPFIWNEEDKAFIRALSDLISASWADYASGRASSEELMAAFNPEWMSRIAKATIWFMEWANHFAHLADKYWPRWPSFYSIIVRDYKRIWLTQKDFKNDLLKFYKNNFLDLKWFKKYAIEKWIDVDVATKFTNDIFPYASASQAMKQLWGLIPYINVFPANIDSMIRMIKDGKAWRVWAIMAWLTAVSSYNYYYNMVDKNWPWADLKNEPWYIRWQSWIATKTEDWSWLFSKPFSTNNSLYELIYWLTYLAWEYQRWNWVDLSSMINPAKNFTYFDFLWKTEQEGISGLLTALWEPIFNVTILWQVAEVMLNKNIRYWSKIYNEGFWINDINPQTSALTKAITSLIIKANEIAWTDMEENMWVIRWWIWAWFNPAAFSHIISKIDPTSKQTSKAIQKAIEEWDTASGLNSALMYLSHKSFKSRNAELSQIYKIKDEQTKEYKLNQFWIKAYIDWVDNIEQLKVVAKSWLQDVANTYWYNSKEYKYFIDVIKKKKLEITSWVDTAVIKDQNSDIIARYMLSIYQKEWKEWVIKFMEENYPNFSQSKRNDINSRFKELNK